MSAKRRSFTSAAPDEAQLNSIDLLDIALDAIPSCSDRFLSPLIANVGHRGIATAAHRITTRLDRMTHPPAGMRTIATIMERAGTC